MSTWNTTVDAPKPRRSEGRVPVICTLSASPNEVAQRRVFDGSEVLVGRAVGAAELWFRKDARVSRQHAVLRFDARALTATLEDTSRGGTFVQGRRTVGTVALNAGDVVRVGDSFFLFRFEEESQAGDTGSEIPNLVGPSAALSALRRTLSLVGKSSATALILGESGTGKELVARALHDVSGRQGAFVAVNCGAIPEALVESQFFGHVAGAFTGAKAEARGWFRAAEGGTLFLDEIGELPLLLQPKLLRAVEERAVTPVGTTQSVPCDVRIVAATNRDLSAREQFRSDLFARISEFVLEIPPIRARREDILPILLHLLEGNAQEIDPDLVQTLLLYDYPHNARDLRRIATQLRVRGADRAIWDASLLENLLAKASPEGESARESSPAADGEAEGRAPGRDEVPSREELVALLAEHRGVVANIARATGRSRKQVYRWLTQYGLAAENYREE